MKTVTKSLVMLLCRAMILWSGVSLVYGNEIGSKKLFDESGARRFFDGYLSDCGTNEIRCVWFLNEETTVGMVMTLDLPAREVTTAREAYNWATQNTDHRKLSYAQVITLKSIIGEIPPSHDQLDYKRSVSIAAFREGKLQVFRYNRTQIPRAVQRIYDIGGGYLDARVKGANARTSSAESETDLAKPGRHCRVCGVPFVPGNTPRIDADQLNTPAKMFHHYGLHGHAEAYIIKIKGAKLTGGSKNEVQLQATIVEQIKGTKKAGKEIAFERVFDSSRSEVENWINSSKNGLWFLFLYEKNSVDAQDPLALQTVTDELRHVVVQHRALCTSSSGTSGSVD